MHKLTPALYNSILKILAEESRQSSKPTKSPEKYTGTKEQKIAKLKADSEAEQYTDDQLSAIDPAMKLSDQPSNVFAYEQEGKLKVGSGKRYVPREIPFKDISISKIKP